MTAVFLASDRRTLLTRHVAHIHISEYEDDDGDTCYETHAFFLACGMLTLATSPWTLQHVGYWLGLIEDTDDPEVLRERADEVVLLTMTERVNMQ